MHANGGQSQAAPNKAPRQPAASQGGAPRAERGSQPPLRPPELRSPEKEGPACTQICELQMHAIWTHALHASAKARCASPAGAPRSGHACARILGDPICLHASAQARCAAHADRVSVSASHHPTPAPPVCVLAVRVVRGGHGATKGVARDRVCDTTTPYSNDSATSTTEDHTLLQLQSATVYIPWSSWRAVHTFNAGGL